MVVLLTSRLTAACAIVAMAAAVFGCGGDDDGATGGETPGAETPQNGPGDGDGGDELTLQEYFTEVDRIFERSDQELDDLNAELSEASNASPTVEEGVSAIDDFLTQSLRVLSDAVDDLEALNTPDDVSEQHDDFLSAVRDGINQTEILQEDFQDVQTEAEFERLSTQFGEDIGQTEQDADAACLELQQIADDNSIVVDLNCED